MAATAGPERAALTARAGYMLGERAERKWSEEQALAWEGLLELHGRLRRGAEARLEQAGLSVSALGVMGRLVGAPERTLRQVELAAAMGLSISRVSRIVDALQERELLERRPCPADARATNVTLTEAGLRLTREAQGALFAFVQESFAARLDAEETATLAAVFSRLLGG
ncbi:MAG TPA: MarR family transcriptional regulator [Solirubrobacterales bacterium]